jgi:hypothetical protein
LESEHLDHSRKRKTYKKCNPSFWEHEFKHQSDVHDEFQASMGYIARLSKKKKKKKEDHDGYTHLYIQHLGDGSRQIKNSKSL